MSHASSRTSSALTETGKKLIQNVSQNSFSEYHSVTHKNTEPCFDQYSSITP